CAVGRFRPPGTAPAPLRPALLARALRPCSLLRGDGAGGVPAERAGGAPPPADRRRPGSRGPRLPRARGRAVRGGGGPGPGRDRCASAWRGRCARGPRGRSLPLLCGRPEQGGAGSAPRTRIRAAAGGAGSVLRARGPLGWPGDVEVGVTGGPAASAGREGGRHTLEPPRVQADVTAEHRVPVD